ncbi:MAG TPA: hypothetical protein VHY21_21535 [Pseudonocardiaceae bacterium]|jgi:cytochrome P450|nr:hypothetical protein [Pseudonocardiaceae bacterium]
MTADLHTIRHPTDPPRRGATLLPWLHEMRDENPVWRDTYGVWHVFRYSDVARVISDPQVFSSDIARVIPTVQRFSAGNLLLTDPPRHHTLRRLVGAAFSPRVVTGLTARIAEVTHELLDATGSASEFDLVTALAYPLPVTVIAELLGLPTADRELFRTWADKLLTALDGADPHDPQRAPKKPPRNYSPTYTSTAPIGAPTPEGT